MTSILSLLCFRETLNGQEAPAIPKPTQEHGWLRKFAGEWRNESMATMGRNIRLLHLRHPQNWGEQDTELGRARHRNRPLDYAIRVRSQRAQEDPRLGDSNRYKSQKIETMGIEQHSEIALGGRRDQRVTIGDNCNRSRCQSVVSMLPKRQPTHTDEFPIGATVRQRTGKYSDTVIQRLPGCSHFP